MDTDKQVVVLAQRCSSCIYSSSLASEHPTCLMSNYFDRLEAIPFGHVGQSKLRRACNMNSVSPPITMVLHSFSPSDLVFRTAWAASSLAMGVLQPVMARRFFAPSVLGLLLKTAPPAKVKIKGD